MIVRLLSISIWLTVHLGWWTTLALRAVKTIRPPQSNNVPVIRVALTLLNFPSGLLVITVSGLKSSVVVTVSRRCPLELSLSVPVPEIRVKLKRVNRPLTCVRCLDLGIPRPPSVLEIVLETPVVRQKSPGTLLW